MGKRRIGRYSKLLEKLRDLGEVPTAGATEADDKKIYKFHQFLIGKSTIKQANKVPEGGRKLFQVALLPFSLSVAGSNVSERYVTTMSAYSLVGLKDRGGNLTPGKLGIASIVGGEQEDAGYYPALIRASFSSTTGALQPAKPSAVTGTKYKYKYKRTFSFPFGRTITSVRDAGTAAAESTLDDADALDVYRSAVDALKSNGNNADVPTTVSYVPELFKTKTRGEALKAATDLPTISVT